MSEVKIIHAADLHLDSAFEALGRDEAEKRRAGQREILYKIAALAEKTGAAAVALSGDVFDTDAAAEASQEAFIKAFGALGVPVFVTPGNHDPYTPTSVWARMALPENVHVFRTERFECVELPGLRVWGAGFEGVFCGSLLEKFEAPIKTDSYDLMVLHGDICSGKSDYNAVTRQQIADSCMDYIALGHIHKRSEPETAGRTSYAYCGCAEGRGYDELGEMGAYVVTMSQSGVAAQFVPLGGVRYEIMQVDVSSSDPVSAVEAAVSGLSERDFCRVILTGECETLPDMALLRQSLEGRLAQLQLRDETVQKRDVWAQTGQDSLAGLFLSKLRAQYDAARDENEKKKLELAAYLGLAALEGGR